MIPYAVCSSKRIFKGAAAAFAADTRKAAGDRRNGKLEKKACFTYNGPENRKRRPGGNNGRFIFDSGSCLHAFGRCFYSAVSIQPQGTGGYRPQTDVRSVGHSC